MRRSQGAGRSAWRRRIAWGVLALVLAGGLFVLAGDALAQTEGDAATDAANKAELSRPVVTMIALGSLSLAPFVLVMTTSFLKFSVVGSILRSAMGTQQIPPNQVLMGLALILTIYVMAPVGKAVFKEVEDIVNQPVDGGILSDNGIERLKLAVERGKTPYLDFLVKHSSAKDRNLFLMLNNRLHRNDDEYVPDEREFTGLVAAFVTSELTEAFQIGFLLFVPFIAVDMIVSNVLLAMGMQMLSPTIVSLPIKLLLFVLVDGWHLLMRGLVLGYV